jgi:hypothetical protein
MGAPCAHTLPLPHHSVITVIAAGAACAYPSALYEAGHLSGTKLRRLQPAQEL